MSRVVVYSSMFCPYCAMATRLLDGKGVEYQEIEVDWDGSKRREMMERANGRHTVPQIFIGDRHVGGYDDLHALDQAGELDPLLEATP
jgi:glutaredoxin 3